MSDDNQTPPPARTPNPDSGARPAPRNPQSEGLAPWEIGRDTPPAPNQPQQPRQAPPAVPRPPTPAGEGLAPWEIGGPNRPAQPSQNPLPPPSIYPGIAATGNAYRPIQTQDFQVRDTSRTGRTAGIVALCIACLLVGWFIAAEFIPMPVAAPTSYSTYKSPDGRYAIAIPTNWSQTSDPVTQNGSGPVGIAIFRDGPAMIQITTDTVAHLKGQILLNSSAALPTDFTADPTKALSDYEAVRVASTIKNYSETTPSPLPTNYGSALVSSFTGLGGIFGWGGPTCGYRASVATDDIAFEIETQCPKGDWKALSPAFLHVIQSIGPAAGGVYNPQPSPTSSTPGMPAVGGIDMGSD